MTLPSLDGVCRSHYRVMWETPSLLSLRTVTSGAFLSTTQSGLDRSLLSCPVFVPMRLTISFKILTSYIAETSRVLYEVNYKLPEEVTLIKRNQDQVLAQTNKIITETEETIQRIEELVPSQIALINMQKAQVTAETNQVNALVTTKLPKEVAQIEAQTSLLAYDLTNIKPVEKNNLISTGLNINTQIVQNTAQTEQITYTTSTVLPANVANVNAQTSLLAYDLTIYPHNLVSYFKSSIFYIHNHSVICSCSTK